MKLFLLGLLLQVVSNGALANVIHESFIGIIPNFTGNTAIFGGLPSSDFENTPISGWFEYDPDALIAGPVGCFVNASCFLSTASNALISETILGVTFTYPLVEVAVLGNAAASLLYYVSGEGSESANYAETFIFVSSGGGGFGQWDPGSPAGISWNFRLSSIEVDTTIPEPASIAILEIGIIGLHATRRLNRVRM